MLSRLYIDSIYDFGLGIFIVLGFDYEFTCKRKCSSWLEGKRRISHSYWFGSWFSHVDVEADFLNSEVFWLFDEQLPYVLLFCLGKGRLFGLQLSRSVSNLYIYDALHHSLDLLEVLLSSWNLLWRKFLNDLLMKLLVFGLFCYFTSAEWAFLVYKEGLKDAFVAECVITVCYHWSVESFITNCTFMLL